MKDWTENQLQYIKNRLDNEGLDRNAGRKGQYTEK